MRGSRFWAKTTPEGEPGISVRDHCLNVGCVAAALYRTDADKTFDVSYQKMLPLSPRFTTSGKLRLAFRSSVVAGVLTPKRNCFPMASRMLGHF